MVLADIYRPFGHYKIHKLLHKWLGLEVPRQTRQSVRKFVGFTGTLHHGFELDFEKAANPHSLHVEV